MPKTPFYKKALHWLNILAFSLVFALTVFFIVIVILPDDSVQLPDIKWSYNLFRSQVDCTFPGYCHRKAGQCMNREIKQTDGKIRTINECYGKEGLRGPDHPVSRRSLNTVRIELYGTNHLSGLWLPEKDSIRAQLERILNNAAMEMGLGLKFEVYNYAYPALFAPSMFRNFIYVGSKRKPDLAIFEYRGDEWFCSFDLYGRRRLLHESKILQLFDTPGIGRKILNRILSVMTLVICKMDREFCKLSKKVIKLAKKDHTQLGFFTVLEFGQPEPTKLFSCLKDPSVFFVWDPDFNGPDREKMWITREPDQNGAFYLAWDLANRLLSGGLDTERLIQY